MWKRKKKFHPLYNRRSSVLYYASSTAGNGSRWLLSLTGRQKLDRKIPRDVHAKARQDVETVRQALAASVVLH